MFENVSNAFYKIRSPIIIKTAEELFEIFSRCRYRVNIANRIWIYIMIQIRIGVKIIRIWKFIITMSYLFYQVTVELFETFFLYSFERFWLKPDLRYIYLHYILMYCIYILYIKNCMVSRIFFSRFFKFRLYHRRHFNILF